MSDSLWQNRGLSRNAERSTIRSNTPWAVPKVLPEDNLAVLDLVNTSMHLIRILTRASEFIFNSSYLL